jgi:transposase-like protein
LPPGPQRRDLEELAQQLVDRAKEEGLDLVGPQGLLAGVTKRVVESALDAELTDHLGYERHERIPNGQTNARNGTTSKTLHTDIGPVTVDVPRDRQGSFEPKIVPKHARRLDGFDEAIISLYAKGLTTGEIQAHLREIYGAEVSRDTISKSHRRGRRGSHRMAEQTAGFFVAGDLHRRDHGQDPRRRGGEPSGLRRCRHQSRR